MPISDLVNAFKQDTYLPIHPDRIQNWIIRNTGIDEIRVVQTDTDVRVIRGFFKAVVSEYRESPYGDIVRRADIFLARSSEPEWTNLMAIAAMVGILIQNPKQITEHDITQELNRVALLPEFQHLLFADDNEPVWRFQRVIAAALLLPFAARSYLFDMYRGREILDTDLAALANLPVEYVQLVMSPEWDYLHATIADFD